VTYNERFYVGYRWHDKSGIAPLFPFGHGLSYTTFEYGAPEVRADNGSWRVRAPVTNTGKVAGKEVVQLYVAYPDAKVERCKKELKAFAKVALAPGETKTVELVLTARDLAYWDDFAHRFRTDAGRYEILVGSSCADIRTSATLAVGVSQVFAD
jgi:beta-glucosidase